MTKHGLHHYCVANNCHLDQMVIQWSGFHRLCDIQYPRYPWVTLFTFYLSCQMNTRKIHIEKDWSVNNI